LIVNEIKGFPLIPLAKGRAAPVPCASLSVVDL
jgi:hypothetical protein